MKIRTTVAAFLLTTISLLTTQASAQYYPNQPYQHQLASHQDSTYHQGVEYGTQSQVGFDQRTHAGFNGNIDSTGDRFVGGQAGVQAGAFAESGVYQSGQVGKVQITNQAGVGTFVGSEADARAGINRHGATVGGGAFSGGRATGNIGTEIGAVGVGGRGEVWAGAGVEAGVNAGWKNGKLKLGGELGAGLGVGGKVGADVTLDVGAVGRSAHKGIRHVDRAASKVGSHVNRHGTKAVNNVKRSVGKTGKKVSGAFKKVGGLFKK